MAPHTTANSSPDIIVNRAHADLGTVSWRTSVIAWSKSVIGVLGTYGTRWAAAGRGLLPPLRFTVSVGILAIAVAVAVLFSSRWDAWVGARADQTTDDAYVRGDLTPLSAKVEGYLRKVPINDFQRVKAGELLVEIEDDDYRARVDQAAADVMAAEASIENLKSRKAQQRAQIAEAESAIAATNADVERTRLEEIRQREMVASTYGTHQRLEQATADEKRFQAMLARARDDLEAQRRQMAVLDTQELQLRADLKSKQAVLTFAKITLGYTRIAAPVNGMVGERGVREGQYVRPGVQVISVVPLDTVWVVGNFKETQLTRVAIGQPASITIDTFPGVVVTGHVDSISPASGSQFSLLPPDNATGNFTKVVQRIPVKIVLDRGHPLSGQLRPGMSVIATIHTDRASMR
jgi:membrane fusion protein (multidrug efflux system)